MCSPCTLPLKRENSTPKLGVENLRCAEIKTGVECECESGCEKETETDRDESRGKKEARNVLRRRMGRAAECEGQTTKKKEA